MGETFGHIRIREDTTATTHQQQQQQQSKSLVKKAHPKSHIENEFQSRNEFWQKNGSDVPLFFAVKQKEGHEQQNP